MPGLVFGGQVRPRGYASSTIFTLLTLSLNALFLGVIGEYVGRIYNQVRRRATTIIERSVDASEGGPDREGSARHDAIGSNRNR